MWAMMQNALLQCIVAYGELPSAVRQCRQGGASEEGAGSAFLDREGTRPCCSCQLMSLLSCTECLIVSIVLLAIALVLVNCLFCWQSFLHDKCFLMYLSTLDLTVLDIFIYHMVLLFCFHLKVFQVVFQGALFLPSFASFCSKFLHSCDRC